MVITKTTPHDYLQIHDNEIHFHNNSDDTT